MLTFLSLFTNQTGIAFLAFYVNVLVLIDFPRKGYARKYTYKGVLRECYRLFKKC